MLVQTFARKMLAASAALLLTVVGFQQVLVVPPSYAVPMSASLA